MLTERSKAILSSLLEKENPVPVASLSKALNVSNRTIRYDLDKVDDWLKSNMLPQLVRKPNYGVEFVRNAQLRHDARTRFRTDFRYYVRSARERKEVILAELLQRKDYVSTIQLAEKISVSRSTIMIDLVEVGRWLAQYDLQLVARRRYGIRVAGDEKALRRCVVDLFNQNLTLSEALELIKPSIPFNGNARSVTDSLLSDRLDIPAIERSVRQIETDLGMVFADVAFANLVLYLALAIRRLQLGKNINMPTVDLDSLKSSLHFEVVENVTKALSERLRIAIPEAEVGYLTQHVLASGVLSNEKSEVSIDLQLAVCNLIGAVGQRLGTVLTSDQQLFEGLTSHIGPAMQRLGRGFVVSNPYLHELRTNHQVMYEVVAECATAAFGSHGVSLPQEEIGFLTLHFGAALERRLLAQAMPAVLVVCGTGVGTASLLSSRLRSNFILKIVGLVAAHKVNELLKSTQVDLIVSTVPLADVEVKTVLVSPFLTPKDVNELRAVLDDRRSPNLSLEDVLQIIGKHCTILDRQGLVRELIRYSSELDVGNKMRADQPLLHLQDALTREYVSIGNTAARWEDAVTIAGTLLVSSGAVELVYVANMIAAIRQFGPYVVIAPGVALPHASSAEGVNKVAISCLRLSTPVVFGHPQNDPVDLLFCFATPDKVSHQLILQELGRLLADAATVKKLRKARSVAAFLNVVREFAQ